MAMRTSPCVGPDLRSVRRGGPTRVSIAPAGALAWLLAGERRKQLPRNRLPGPGQ